MRRAGVFAAAIMMAFAVSAYASGNAEAVPGDWAAAKSGQKVAVSGTLRLVGTGLFNDYVITDAQGHDWYVDKAERAAVKGYEQRAIAVEAVVTRESMTLADGTKLEDKRALKKIKLIVKD
jgi:hypothetical protein